MKSILSVVMCVSLILGNLNIPNINFSPVDVETEQGEYIESSEIKIGIEETHIISSFSDLIEEQNENDDDTDDSEIIIEDYDDEAEFDEVVSTASELEEDIEEIEIEEENEEDEELEGNEATESEIEKSLEGNEATESEIEKSLEENEATSSEIEKELLEATSSEIEKELLKATNSETKKELVENEATESEIEKELDETEATESEIEKSLDETEATKSEIEKSLDDNIDSKISSRSDILLGNDNIATESEIKNEDNFSFIRDIINGIKTFFGAIGSKTNYLSEGNLFNQKIKSLSGIDSCTKIQFGDYRNLIEGHDTVNVGFKVAEPVYALIDGNVLYITTENGENIKISPDCSNMFKDLHSVEEIIFKDENNNIDFNFGGMTKCDYMFAGCVNLQNVKANFSDYSLVTSIKGMFKDCASIESLDFSYTYFNKCTDFSEFASGCTNLKSINFGNGCEFENVLNASSMFKNCTNLTSTNLNNYSFSSVTNISNMFAGTGFTTLDLSFIKSKDIQNMSSLFENCKSLQSVNVDNLCTDKALNMNNMFYGDTALTTLNLCNFNTSKADCTSMFDECTALKTIYASGMFKVQNDNTSMFYNCSSLVGGEGTKYDEGKYKSDYACIDGYNNKKGYFTYTCLINFEECVPTKYIGSTSGKLPEKITMSDGVTFPNSKFTWSLGTFKGWTLYKNIATEIYKRENANSIFTPGTSVMNIKNSLFLVGGSELPAQVSVYPVFELYESTNMLSGPEFQSKIKRAFSNATAVSINFVNSTLLNLGDFNYKLKVDLTDDIKVYLDYSAKMYIYSDKIIKFNQDSSHMFDLTDQDNFFENGIESINFNGLVDTSEVKNMEGMFRNLKNLTELDIKCFNMENVTNAKEAFAGDKKLDTILVNSDCKLKNLTTSIDMFKNCNKVVGERGTKYDASNIDGKYAKIDQGVKDKDNLGYFSCNKNIWAVNFRIVVPPKYRSELFNANLNVNRYLSKGCELPYINNNNVDVYIPEEFAIFGWTLDRETATSLDMTKGNIYAIGDSFRPYLDENCANQSGLRIDACVTLYAVVKKDNKASLLDGQIFNEKVKTLTNFNECVEIHFGNFEDDITDGIECVDVSKEKDNSIRAFVKQKANKTYKELFVSSKKTIDFPVNSNKMFYQCSNIKNIDFVNTCVDTINVVNMESMFEDCSLLEKIDLKCFHTDRVTNAKKMFYNCKNLDTIIVENNFSNSSLVANDMFYDCIKIVGESGTTFKGNQGAEDKKYAIIDKGEPFIGYLSSGDSYKVILTGVKPDSIEGILAGEDTVTKLNKYADLKIEDNLFSLGGNTRLFGWTLDENLAKNPGDYTSDKIFKRNASLKNAFDDAGYTVNNVDPIPIYTVFKEINEYKLVSGEDFNNTIKSLDGFSDCKKIAFGNYNSDALLVDDRVSVSLEEGLIWVFIKDDVIYVSSKREIAFNEDSEKMFYNCTNIEEIEFGSYVNVYNTTNFTSMFENCEKIKELDLTAFNLNEENLTMNRMFYNCKMVDTITVNTEFLVNKTGNNGDQMFYNCISIVGECNTSYDSNNVGLSYAMIDQGVAYPGYLCSDGYFILQFRTDSGGIINLDDSKNYPLVEGVMRDIKVNLKCIIPDLDINFPGYELKGWTESPRHSYSPDEYATKVKYKDDSGREYDNSYELEHELGVLYELGGVSNRTVAEKAYSYGGQIYESYKHSHTNGEKITLYPCILPKPETPNIFDTGSNCNTEIKSLSGFNDCDKIVFGNYENLITGSTVTVDVSENNNNSIRAFIVDNVVYISSSEGVYFNADSSNYFKNMSNIKEIDFGTLIDSQKIYNMSSMFEGCSGLTYLDLTKFTTYEQSSYFFTVGGMKNRNYAYLFNRMFKDCSNLKRIYVNADYFRILPKAWEVTEKEVSGQDMFSGCDKLIGNAGTKYTPGNDDVKYAYIDKYYYENTKEQYDAYLSEKMIYTLHFDKNKKASTLTGTIEGKMDDLVIEDDCILPDSKFQLSNAVFLGWTFNSEAVENPDAHKNEIFSEKTAVRNYLAENKDKYPNRSVLPVYPVYTTNETALLENGEDFNRIVRTLNGFENCNKIYFGNYMEILDGTDKILTKSVHDPETDIIIYAFIKDNILYISTDKQISFNRDSSKMFENMTNIVEIRFTKGNEFVLTDVVVNMEKMFDNCDGLKELDVSCFDTKNVINTNRMFYSCDELMTIYASEKFVVDKVTKSTDMFTDSIRILGGEGTGYDINKIDKEYACIDKRITENVNGYFTLQNKTYNAKYTKCKPDGCTSEIKGEMVENQQLINLCILKETDWYIDGYRFIGWTATESDAKDYRNAKYTIYEPGDSIYSYIKEIGLESEGTIILYSVFSELPDIEMKKDATEQIIDKIPNAENCKRIYFGNYEDIYDGSTKIDVGVDPSVNVFMIGDILYFSSVKPVRFNKNSEGLFKPFKHVQEIDFGKEHKGTNWAITDSVLNMSSMFDGLQELVKLDLSEFVTSSVTDISRMFYDCISLETILATNRFSTNSLTDAGKQNVFNNDDKLIGGKGTEHVLKKVDTAEYARLDEGPNSSYPGYFTAIDQDVYYVLHFINVVPNEYSGTETKTGDMLDIRVQRNHSLLPESLFYAEENFEFVGWTFDEEFALDPDYGDISNIYSVGSSASSYLSTIPSGTTVNVYTVYKKSTEEHEPLEDGNTFHEDLEDILEKHPNCTEIHFGDYENITPKNDEKNVSLGKSGDIKMFVNDDKVYVSSSRIIDFNADSSNMFKDLSQIVLIDFNVGHVDTSQTTNMSSMFEGCTGLTKQNIVTFTSDSINNASRMFYGCNKLDTIFATNNFDLTSKTGNFVNMFTNDDKLVGGLGTSFKENKDNSVTGFDNNTFACLDTDPSPKGYFSTDECCYTLSFNLYLNNCTTGTATGYMENQYVSKIIELPDQTYDVDGLDFLGWRFNDDGTGEIYKVGDDVTEVISTLGYKKGDTVEVYTAFVDATTKEIDEDKVPDVFDELVGFDDCEEIHFGDFTGLSVGTDRIDIGKNGHIYAFVDNKKCYISSDLIITFPKDSSEMFKGLKNIKIIDFGIDVYKENWVLVNNVESMDSMFEGCSSLTKLDLDYFETENLQSTSKMFYDCSKLITIYATTSFDNSNIKVEAKSKDMFKNAYNLVGGAGTLQSNEHVLGDYAILDEGPKSSNPGYFSKRSEDYYYIKYVPTAPNGFKATDLVGEEISKKITEPYIFDECSFTLKNASFVGWTADETVAKGDIPYVVGTNTYSANTSFVKLLKDNGVTINNNNPFVVYSVFKKSEDITIEEGKEVDEDLEEGISGFDKSLIKEIHFGNYEYKLNNDKTITKVDVTASDGSSKCQAFVQGDVLYFSSVDPVYLNRNSSKLFKDYVNVEIIDFGKTGWVMTTLTSDMSYMFENCKVLPELDLQNFNTSKVTDMNSMFNNCEKLKTIFVNKNFSVKSVTNDASMFNNCNLLEGNLGTKYIVKKETDSANYKLKKYAVIDQGPNSSSPGYFTGDFTEVDGENDNTLKDSLDELYDTPGFRKIHFGNFNSMIDSASGHIVKRVEKTGSKPISVFVVGDIAYVSSEDIITFAPNTCVDLFKDLSDVIEIKFNDYVDTTKVESMVNMFYNLPKLGTDGGDSTLDLKCFDTNNVKNMTNMFYNCKELTTIIATERLKRVDTTTPMFNNDEKLVGGKGTAYADMKTEDSSSYNLSKYAVLDKGTKEPGYFTAATSILEQGKDFNDDIKPESKGGTTGLEDYTKIKFGDFSDMLDDPSIQPVVDLSDPSNPNSVQGFVKDGTLYISSEDPIEFNEDASGMFKDLEDIEDIDFNDYISTDKTKDMSNMFNNTFADDSEDLYILDLTDFNTENVDNFDGMFANDPALAGIEVSEDFKVDDTDSTDNMFKDDKNLEGGRGTKYSEEKKEHPTEADGGKYAKDDGGSEDPGYLTLVYTPKLEEGESFNEDITPASKGGTGGLPDYTRIEFGDFSDILDSDESIRPIVDLGEKDEEGNPIHPGAVQGFVKDGTLYISSKDPVDFNEDSSGMFKDLGNIKEIDFNEHINTENTENMKDMFNNTFADDSEDLYILDLTDFNTDKVEDFEGMFANDTALAGIKVSEDFKVDDTDSTDDMFLGDKNLQGGKGTKYSEEKMTNPGEADGGKYAKYDQGPDSDSPGYLTLVKTEKLEKGEDFNRDIKPESKGGTTGLADYTKIKFGDFSDMLDDESIKPIIDLGERDEKGEIINPGAVQGFVKDGTLYISSENTIDFNEDSSGMFKDLEDIEDIDFNDYITTDDTNNMKDMFYNTFSNESKGTYILDITDFDTSDVKDFEGMFAEDDALAGIKVSDKFKKDRPNAKTDDMFTNDNNLQGGKGTKYTDRKKYDSTQADNGKYAVDDQGPSSAKPGYFTLVNTDRLEDGEKFNDDIKPKSKGGDLDEYTEIKFGDFSDKLKDKSIKTIDIGEEDPLGNKKYPGSALAFVEDGILYISTEDPAEFNDDASGMFKDLEKIKDIDFNDHIATDKTSDMSDMFNNTFADDTNLYVLDVTDFDTKEVENFDNMFANDKALSGILVSEDFVVNPKATTTDMFKDDINLTGGQGTKYSNKVKTDKDAKNGKFAVDDLGPNSSRPGYFTLANKPKPPYRPTPVEPSSGSGGGGGGGGGVVSGRTTIPIDGWYKEEVTGDWYYYKDSLPIKGWYNEPANKQWYFFDYNTSKMLKDYQIIGGDVYYFEVNNNELWTKNASGIYECVTPNAVSEGGLYQLRFAPGLRFAGADGVIDNFFGDTAFNVRNYNLEDLNNDKNHGWSKSGEDYVYINEDGSLSTGWIYEVDSNIWRYIDLDTKKMARGYRIINDKVYYFSDFGLNPLVKKSLLTNTMVKMGEMFKDTNINGLVFNKEGECTNFLGKQ